MCDVIQDWDLPSWDVWDLWNMGAAISRREYLKYMFYSKYDFTSSVPAACLRQKRTHTYYYRNPVVSRRIRKISKMIYFIRAIPPKMWIFGRHALLFFKKKVVWRAFICLTTSDFWSYLLRQYPFLRAIINRGSKLAKSLTLNLLKLWLHHVITSNATPCSYKVCNGFFGRNAQFVFIYFALFKIKF